MSLLRLSAYLVCSHLEDGGVGAFHFVCNAIAQHLKHPDIIFVFFVPDAHFFLLGVTDARRIVTDLHQFFCNEKWSDRHETLFTILSSTFPPTLGTPKLPEA